MKIQQLHDIPRSSTIALFASLVIGAAVPAIAQDAGVSSVTNEMLAEPDPADWLMWRRTVNSWGYSPLDQIDKSNVANLELVWSRDMGDGVNEPTPLVHDGVMFLPNPLDYIQALDATTGELKWEYRRELPEDLRRFIPNPQGNRNLAIYGKTIIDTSADDFVFALNADTGELEWEKRILDYRESPAQETSGPIVAGGKIFSTRGCEWKFVSPDGCAITAHDAVTGEELWRTLTIPRKGEPNDDSWGNVPENKRHHVGAWMVPSFDPELNMLYVGTSVTSPAPKYHLDGNDKKYLYHNSTLALNADTGEIVWYYQHVVDHWDLDHPFERLLLDTAVAPNPDEVAWINPNIRPGEVRKVVTGIPGKTGIVYTLDRQTGEFLWARPTVFQNVVQNIDGATGEVTVNPETTFTEAGQTRFVCPNSNGGKNFQAGAYSPLTNMMYYGLQNTCFNVTSIDNPNSAYQFNGRSVMPPGREDIGTLFAISAETGETVWRYDQKPGIMSSVTTGGGLLFTGDTAGHFRAFDQQTGDILWDYDLGAVVSGYPVTFAVNGKQYVAVATGNGLAASGVNRMINLSVPNDNRIYVFALPE